MIPRRPGQDLTRDTRAEAGETINKDLRHRQVLKVLEEIGPATAKEVAVEMHRRGMTSNDERNNAAPRLTELCKLGRVEPIGRKLCSYTGKSVAVYAKVSAETSKLYYYTDNTGEALDGEVF